MSTASAADMAFVGKHTLATVRALKPRLDTLKQSVISNKPINTVAPAVTGTGTVGQTLTTNTGTWLNSPTYAYQWLRDGFAIGSATATTYVLVAADSGHNVSCQVTGANAAGVSSAVSNIKAVA